MSLGSLYTTCFFRCFILPHEPFEFLSSCLPRVSFHTCSLVTGMPISLGIALRMHHAGLGVWQAPLPPSASERRRILPRLATESKSKRESGNYPADSGYIFKAALEFWFSSSFLLTYHNLAQQLSIHTIHTQTYHYTQPSYRYTIHTSYPRLLESSLPVVSLFNIITTTPHLHPQVFFDSLLSKSSLSTSASPWSQDTFGPIVGNLMDDSSNFLPFFLSAPATIRTPEQRVSPSE